MQRLLRLPRGNQRAIFHANSRALSLSAGSAVSKTCQTRFSTLTSPCHTLPCYRALVTRLQSYLTYSTLAIKPRLKLSVKSAQCPGCGAVFQRESPDQPGYLTPEKFREVHQVNAVKSHAMLSPTDSLTLPPADMAAKADQKPTLDSISKKNKLTDKEFEAMAMAIDNSELRDLFVLPRDEKSVRDGDPNPTGAATRQPASTLESDSSSPECEPKPANRKPVVCQRCHSLIHYNRLASDHSGMTANPSGASHRSQPVLPWKANVITDPRALQFLKYERNALIIVVCDIFDIPGSLIPNLGQFIGSNVLELVPPSKAPPRLGTATVAQDVDGKSNDSGSRPRRRRVLLVANKSDLLPEDAHLDRIKSQWLKPLVRKALGSTLSITSYHIVSSRKNLGIRELAQDIRKYRRPQDNVFLVGRANVGKSELLNALLRISVLESAGSYRGTVTTANVPGTTIGVHGIPLDKFNRALVEPGTSMSTMGERRFVYDTPGIFNSKSILNFLTFDELKLAVPTNRIRPATYIVKTGKCVCLGGLGRVDVLPPSDIADETGADVAPRIQQQYLLVTVFSALKPHITSIEKADTLFRNLREGRRTVLIPPLPVDSEQQRHYPPLKQGLEFVYKGVHHTMATCDIVFGGVGWVSITGKLPGDPKIRVRAYSPFGTAIYHRESPLLPFEFKGKVEKHKSNMRKNW